MIDFISDTNHKYISIMRYIFWGAVFGFIAFRYVGAVFGAVIGYFISINLKQKPKGNPHRQNQTKANFEKEEDSLSLAYKTLELPESASLEEIRRAYRQKCKALHPDTLNSKNLNKTVIATLEKELRKVVSAYELILKFRSKK